MNQLLRIISRMAGAFLITFLSFSSYSQSNYAVSFDGVDDFIAIPNVVSSDFTVEYWMKTSATGSSGSQWYNGNGIIDAEVGGVTNDWGTALLSNKLAFGIGNPDITITSASNVNTGNWVHVAATWKQSTGAMQLYINGVLEASATGGTNLRNAPPRITMGEIQTNISRFTGSIDEVRIWNTVRTQAQIKANMFNKNLSNSASGLVAYYKMNEGSGTTAANSCTNTSSIDGTLTNGPTWSASPIQFAGNALHFDQADDRVIAPLATTATSNVTMELWVNHEGGTGTDHLLVSNGVMGTNGYAMYINTQRKLCIQYNAVGTWNTNYVLTSNTWTHIALVIGTTGFIVYANGANVYSNTATPVTPTGSFILGYNTVASGQPFDGKMDEVRIWNTARTQTEIQNNMNAEIDPSTSGLTLYYTFDEGVAGGTNTGLTTVIDQSGNNNGTLTNFSLSGSTSNFLTQNSSMFVLPLKWLSVSAQKQNENVLLQWSTASEINTSDFQIEHSTDGKSWTVVATVVSNNNNGINHYSYLHSNASTGINYYRIRQNDRDGKYSYSKIISVTMEKEASVFKIVANPVTGKMLHFEINSSSNQILSLVSSDGKTIWSTELSPGIHTININQPAGIYFLKAGTHTARLVFQ
jgi:hypothetical protein